MSRADHVAGAAAKLGKLVEIERCASSDELLEAAFSDAVSPAICTNEGATSHARWSRIRTPAFAYPFGSGRLVLIGESAMLRS